MAEGRAAGISKPRAPRTPGRTKPPKRESKNQPQVLSSKRPVSSFRIAPGLKGEMGTSSANNKRDPRFDPMGGGGAVDERKWRKAYSFLFDQQAERIKELQEQLKRSADAAVKMKHGGGSQKKRARERLLAPEAETEMRAELARLQNKQKRDEEKRKEEEVLTEIRKQQVSAAKQGKGVFFPKKSAIREKMLTAKYEELKKNGKLEKYLMKRRKKIATKQHKRLPSRREDTYGPNSAGYE